MVPGRKVGARCAQVGKSVWFSQLSASCDQLCPPTTPLMSSRCGFHRGPGVPSCHKELPLPLPDGFAPFRWCCVDLSSQPPPHGHSVMATASSLLTEATVGTLLLVLLMSTELCVKISAPWISVSLSCNSLIGETGWLASPGVPLTIPLHCWTVIIASPCLTPLPSPALIF